MRPLWTRQRLYPPTLLHIPYPADSPSQTSLATPKSGQRCSPRPSRHAHPPAPFAPLRRQQAAIPDATPSRSSRPSPLSHAAATPGEPCHRPAVAPPPRPPRWPTRPQHHCHRGHGKAPRPLPCGRAPSARPRRPTRQHWRAQRAPPLQLRQRRAEPSGVAAGLAAPPAAAATLAATKAGRRPLRDRLPHRQPPRRGRPCPGTSPIHHWGAFGRTARGRRRGPRAQCRPRMARSPSAGCSQMARRAALGPRAHPTCATPLTRVPAAEVREA